MFISNEKNLNNEIDKSESFRWNDYSDYKKSYQFEWTLSTSRVNTTHELLWYWGTIKYGCSNWPGFSPLSLNQ